MTATDSPPLVNVLGDEVSALAASGRVVVAPNALIQSAWGNLVFDQSTNQFVSVADRDSQWPAPPDGAICYTGTEQTFWVRRGGAWLALYGGTQPPYTGAGIGSYTDPNGEVWVAKASVNGGVWKKARDVLQAKVYRAAAFSTPTAQTVFAFDTVAYDPYGLWQPNNFVVPVAGLYRFTAIFTASILAAGQFVQAIMNQGGSFAGSLIGSTIYPGAVAAGVCTAATDAKCAATDTINLTTRTSVVMTGSATLANTNFTISYVGTG